MNQVVQVASNRAIEGGDGGVANAATGGTGAVVTALVDDTHFTVGDNIQLVTGCGGGNGNFAGGGGGSFSIGSAVL